MTLLSYHRKYTTSVHKRFHGDDALFRSHAKEGEGKYDTLAVALSCFDKKEEQVALLGEEQRIERRS